MFLTEDAAFAGDDCTFRHTVSHCGRLTSVPSSVASIVRSGDAMNLYDTLFCTGCMVNVPVTELVWENTKTPVAAPKAGIEQRLLASAEQARAISAGEMPAAQRYSLPANDRPTHRGADEE